MNSSLPRKSTRRGEQKRDQIRRAAYACFRDAGYHDASVDAICERAGISKGSFYWHYASKQEVFVDILDTWARQVMDELYDQFEQSVLHHDYIGAVTAALQREMRRGRAIVPLWLEFTLQARREPEIRQALSKFYRRARMAIAEVLRPAARGKLDEAQLQAVATTIFGAYTGLMVQEVSDPDESHVRTAVEDSMAVLGFWLGQAGEAEASDADADSDGEPQA